MSSPSCVCPHTAICVSSYCYICVLIILGVPQLCPHRRKGSKGIEEALKSSMLETEAFRQLQCPEGNRCQVNNIPIQNKILQNISDMLIVLFLEQHFFLYCI